MKNAWLVMGAVVAAGAALAVAQTLPPPGMMTTRPRGTPTTPAGGAATRPATTKSGTTAMGATKPVAAAVVDRAAVLRELTDYSVVGMNRRLGPDYSFYHKTAEKFPEVYLAPSKGSNGPIKRWQIGEGRTGAGGDFSSTQGQILYAPTNKNDFGCDRVTIIEWTNGVWTESPEPPWHGGRWRPDKMMEPWANEFKSPLGQPIGAARGLGGWSNCGLILHSSGFIGTSGTVTAEAKADAWVALPKTKLPTAISVTNKNEFALVTVVDMTTGKGQVAVLVLSSSSQGFAHEWRDNYPGLPNVAMLSGMKILGYVDLPGISFPTSVSAVGNHNTNRMNGRDGNAGVLKEYNLARAADREVFYKGNNASYASTTGFAVVGAKYENKVAFLDLQPLFQKMREAYFTTDEEFAKTRDMGGGKKWPPTFEFEPGYKPAVVKVVDVDKPTAVIAAMTGGEKAGAVAASMDGMATVFAVGGLATTAEATEDDVKEVGTFELGKNVTCLTYQKGSGDAFIATSRGDRELIWLTANHSGGRVTRRLKDARLIDPVYVEQSDTHGVEAHVVTVADFQGKKILNYRVGRVVFATQGGAKYGCGPAGEDETECGGTFEFPGHPFAISATNVN